MAEPIQPLPLTMEGFNHKKVKLGEALFNDVRLSKTNTVSCASCHRLQTSGADGLKFSRGINQQLGQINAPTIFNSRFNFKQFWDGRARTLEDQIDGPTMNSVEMGSNWNEIISKLIVDTDYERKFKEIYKEKPTPANIKNAIVEFEKTLVTPNSRFDQFLRGDKNAITEQELHGYNKFKSYGCIACHQGMNIGGNMYQSMGVMADYFKERGTPLTSADFGLYNVTKMDRDKYVFKVPSLRNVELTPPYFHDGTAKTLEVAVSQMLKYQLWRTISKSDIKAIVAFLKTLTGEKPNSLRLPASKQGGSK